MSGIQQKKDDLEQLLSWKFDCYFLTKYGQEDIFHLQFEPMAAILEKCCIFLTTNARCIVIVLKENSDDFEDLLLWEFACNPFAQWSQGEFLICNMRLRWSSWKWQ